MILNPKIFRAYDIRGEAFVDFDEDGFFVTAQAFAEFIKQKYKIHNPRIFVSGDGRNSLPELFPSVISGLKAQGAEVTWGGSVPTPINFFAFHEDRFDAAIQISASHNPPQDNGLKLSGPDGAICGDEIQEILELTKTQEPVSADGKCENACHMVDFFGKYKTRLNAEPKFKSPLKIVVDAGNAIPGGFYPEILESFGATVSQLYCDLNPSFPNHQPDPERPENLQDLIQEVKTQNADLGFAYDGDGDRVGVVLNDGKILLADHILYILSADFLSRNPGGKIVIDAMSSDVLASKIADLGGVVIRAKTGHSFIEEAMHEHGALMGGEQSGHFMFGENFYGHDDACLASIRFINAIQQNPALIAEVTGLWPDLHEYSEKITVPDEEKFEILNRFIVSVLALYPDADTTDGVRISFGDNEWAIIRCSNTSPKIAIRIESKTKEEMNTRADQFLELLEKSK